MLKAICKTIAVLPLAALVLVAVPATAETYSVKVSYAGLDLTKPAGVAELDHRINRAVISICGSGGEIDLVARNEVRRCLKGAFDSVEKQRDIVIAEARSSSDRQQLAAK